MKHIKTDNTGGMPLKQYTLAKLQESYFELFYSMISFLGINQTTGKYIISGCEIVGSDITAGWMFIDGDLVYFAGAIGDATTKFKKAITAETAAFKSGENKPLYYTSIVQIDPTGTLITDFVRVNPIVTLPAGLVIDPADLTATPPEKTVLERITEIEKKVNVFQAGGGMVLWNKPFSAIPPGWQEVVDWRGRIPVGMDITVDGSGNFVNPEFSPVTTGGSDPGRTGGNKKHTLTKAQLPNYNLERPVGQETVTGGPEVIWASKAGSAYTQLIPSGGSDQPFSILNPYRTVLFIEYIG